MKKKIMVLLCCLCLFFAQLPEKEAQAEIDRDEPTNLYARSAVLMDADSGRILFGKDEKRRLPMASTTKIMTCILVLEHMEEGGIASVSDYAVCQPKVRLGVRKEDQFYVRDLLYSLMLESHNDSAVVLAENVAGTVEQFAKLMNEKAEELGCEDTHFVTPNGLDGEDEKGIHATTAKDLARIMRYCIMESEKREEFLEVTRTKDYSFSNVKGDRNFSCHNHNAFLTMMDGALSGKTGFTADAGYCYVGALRQGERTLIVSLLACGWPNHKDYKWKDTKKLMEYGLENYQYRDIWENVGRVPVSVTGGRNLDEPLRKSSKVYAEAVKEPQGFRFLLREDEKVKIKVETDQSLTAPVKRGQKIGTIFYQLNGETIGSFDLKAVEMAERRDVWWCLGLMLKEICF